MSNQIYFNNHNIFETSKNADKNTKLFTEGENVKYVVTKRLSPEQAIITIKGQKLLADISVDKPDRGIAKVILSFGKLELKIENPSQKTTSTYTQNIESNEIVQILIQNSIKATAENIDYMQKVLKYFPNMNKYHLGLIFSFMSKNMYPTINQLSAFFSDLLLKDLKQQLDKYVNKHKTISFNEKLNNVDNSLNDIYAKLFKNNTTIDKALYNAIQNNGYYTALLLLLDMFDKQDDIDIVNTLKDIILRLSTNRKSKFQKSNVYSVAILIDIDGRDRFIEIFVSDNSEIDKDDFILGSICYDDNEVLFNVFIKEVLDGYKIEVNIFDERLYLNCQKTENVLENNIKELFLKNNKNVVLEVFFGEAGS